MITTVLTEYEKMALDLEVKTSHRILRYAWGDYRIIKRFTKFQPFVVCYKYDFNSHSWCQGHYFDTLEDAITYLYNLKHGK